MIANKGVGRVGVQPPNELPAGGRHISAEMSTSLTGLGQRALGVVVAISAVAIQCLWAIRAAALVVAYPLLGTCVVLNAIVCSAWASYVVLSRSGDAQKRSALKTATIVSATPLAWPSLVGYFLAKYLLTREINVIDVRVT